MPKQTFPQYKRHCGWHQHDTEPLSSTRVNTHIDCDAIIIGGGYTGISIAQQLADLNPQEDIRVIDSERIGRGSSGRNSGFLLENVFKGLNPKKSKALYQHYQATHQEIMEKTLFSKIEQQKPNILKGAATPKGIHNLEKLANSMLRSGQSFDWINREQINAITGSNYYQAGLLLPNNSLLNPVNLILSLAKQLPNNIKIHENSPALSLSRQGNYWKVETPEGTLKAPKIFLANNAFAKCLGFTQEFSVTIYTYAAITEQLDAQERNSVLSRGQWGILPAHRLGSTFRSTEDGRILVRGMYSYEEEAGFKVETKLLESLKKRFPNITSAQSIDQCWGGTTSLTSNGAPLWGQLERGLFTSIGCNGVGIIKSWMLGKELAKLSNNLETLDIPNLFGTPHWMPSEPFRKMGFITLSQFEKNIAGAEK